MRPIWSGTISFGLINIPVKLYSALVDKSLSFHMLHRKDLSPVRFAKVCKIDGKEVPWEDIAKGYEYQEGDYVLLNEDDFKKADRRLTKTIDVLDFVTSDSIDTSYFEKPYYLEPEKSSQKAYALLREALKKSKKVGVAKFVIRSRERLGLIKAQGDLIVLNQMSFFDELRSPKELDLPKEDIIRKEDVDVALTFINQMTTKFDPKKYKDDYTDKLEEIIEEKARGKRPKAHGTPPEPTEVKDLMALLRKSLEQGRQRAPAHA